MKLIRRHIQSISLLAIAGFLLAGAFFISQQIRPGERRHRSTTMPATDVMTMSDVPTCTRELTREAKFDCYSEAVEVSDRLINALVDDLLDLEPGTARRIAFVETQIAWEEARDADCAFVRGALSDPENGELQELICLLEHNLLRLEQLEGYLHDWYDIGD